MSGNDAVLESGKQLWKGSSGRWAGEQMIKAVQSGVPITASLLRTNAVLNKDEWIEYDMALIDAAQPRLRAVADLIAAGLTRPIANSMGKTLYEWERLGDMDGAIVSMDGMVRSENDRAEFDYDQIPLPITHKDFFINLRSLSASRNKGESLDTTNIRLAGRKIAEKQEDMLLNGSKTFAGKTIYGYRNHPFRQTDSFGTNGAWSAAAKTGDNILADVFSMIDLSIADDMFGPWVIYIPRDAQTKMGADFKADSDLTIQARLLEVEGVQAVRVLDYLPTANVLMVSMQEETVTLLQGEPLQTVQWDIEGGFGINFKAFQIQVPLVRAISGQSGIIHMT